MKYTKEQKETMNIYLKIRNEKGRSVIPSDVTTEEATKIVKLQKSLSKKQLGELMRICIAEQIDHIIDDKEKLIATMNKIDKGLM